MNVTLNYYRRDSKREIEIVTESATIKGDLLQCKVTDHNKNILFEAPTYNIKQTYTQQMKYFIDQVRSHKDIMNNFSDAIDVLKIALS